MKKRKAQPEKKLMEKKHKPDFFCTLGLRFTFPFSLGINIYVKT